MSAVIQAGLDWISAMCPLQVFDLTKGGPGPAIQMFKHVPDVRLLACGGDGTAGWVLSVLDKVRHTATTDTSILCPGRPQAPAPGGRAASGHRQ